MSKHYTRRICRVKDVTPEMLQFVLSRELLARIPHGTEGAELTFSQCIRPCAGKRYRLLVSLAKVSRFDPAACKTRSSAAAAQVIGIIWDDDPEWLYESAPPGDPRVEDAEESTFGFAKLTRGTRASLYAELPSFRKYNFMCNRLPIPIFMTAALVCAFRGSIDPASAAQYWNSNFERLQRMTPSGLSDFEQEVTPECAAHIFAAFTPAAVKEMISAAGWWARIMLSPREASEHGDIAKEIDRDLFFLRAIDTSNENFSTEHLLFPGCDKPSRMIEMLEFRGDTVFLDARYADPETAWAVLDRGGFYVAEIGESQPALLAALKTLTESAAAEADLPDTSSTGVQHMRYVTVPAAGLPEEMLAQWPGLRGGCAVKAVSRSFNQQRGEWDAHDSTSWHISSHPYGDGTIAQWLGECLQKCDGRISSAIAVIRDKTHMDRGYPSSLRTCLALGKAAQAMMDRLASMNQTRREDAKPCSAAEIGEKLSRSLEAGLKALSLLSLQGNPQSGREKRAAAVRAALKNLPPRKLFSGTVK